jgi:AcrR family transcriptional regulator
MTEPIALDGAVEPRLRLLDAAMEEFAEQGFAAASVRAICQRAGLNVAAVNYYYRDKETLYIEAVKKAHNCSFEGTPPLPIGIAQTPEERLRQFIHQMAAQMLSPVSPAAMKLVMREMSDPGRAAHVVVEEFIRPLAHQLCGIVRDLMPQATESHTLMVAFSIIGQLLYYRQNRPISEMLFGREAMARLSLEAVAEHVTRFSLAALGSADPIRPVGGTP